MKTDIKLKIGKNLEVLRKQRNLTQGDLAKALKSTQKSISSYECGRAAPKPELLEEILEYFGITYEILVRKNLEELSDAELYRLLFQSKSKQAVLAITVDADGNENTELVPVKAAAGYTKGYDDPEYIQQLPKFRLPWLPPGTYRAFEIEGFSMLPVEPGSVVIGKFTDPNPSQLKPGKPYIFVFEDGIVFKRMYPSEPMSTTYQKLTFVSDNPTYHPFERNVEEIREVWEAYKVISDLN
ncbi:MAG: LexA family transcriptional regulator [Bacteroidota bacterium]